MHRAIAICGGFLLLAGIASAQKLPWQDTPEAGGKTPQRVRFEGPDQTEVAAHKPQVVELRFRIQEGFHINSHTPHEKNLIPTQLLVVDGDGVNVSAVDFPPGADTSFAFAPNDKVSVYTGVVTLRAHMTVAPGGHLLQGALRYQACDANACMPPRKIPVAISLLAK
ncbi:MAG TPA: protein-disulfide reductase DsbD domain-containing protein [Acidobacteriaceae bacterium]|nr:protein-disulfide reductase DsbD domain-containing protein [Acidobacteriaceae bacterium]